MKSGPIIVISSLAAILIFIIGVNYGKSIKVTDEAVDKIIKKIPTQTQATITKNPLELSALNSSTCMFSFLYPSSFKVEKTSSLSGKITEQNKEMLAFSCGENLLENDFDLNSLASSEAKLSDKNAVSYKSDDYTIYIVSEPSNKERGFWFKVNKEYEKLFSNTLKFK